MHRQFVLFVFLALLTSLLGGCGNTWFGSEKQPISGERVALVETTREFQGKTSALKSPSLSEPVKNLAWSQAGGDADHAPGHVALKAFPSYVWRNDIGSGASGYTPIVTGPVAAEGLVFALETEGVVSAVDLSTGETKWRVSIRPEGMSGEAIGGGLACANGKIYVSSPYAEVLALDIKDGAVLWREALYSPARVSPTVQDGRVFVLTITNELQAFNAETGDELWDHAGMMETAGILGGASPAVGDGVVIVAYSSGEIFALKAENGHELWSEGLVPRFQLDSVSALTHIRARPIISNGVVYAVSHSGKIAAINLRTGERLWEQPVGGLHTPAVDKDALFFISQDNELVALERSTGSVIWRTQLNLVSSSDKGGIEWSGPVLAGNHLVLTGSNGHIRFYSPQTGELVHTVEWREGIPVSPIVVDETLVVFTQGAELVAFR